MVLRGYRSAFERYWEKEGVEYDTFFDDWTYLLPGANWGEEYDSDHAGVFEVLAVDERAACIRRSTLLPSEHARFMAW